MIVTVGRLWLEVGDGLCMHLSPIGERRHVRLRPAQAEGRAKGEGGAPVAGKRGGWMLVDGWMGG